MKEFCIFIVRGILILIYNNFSLTKYFRTYIIIIHFAYDITFPIHRDRRAKYVREDRDRNRGRLFRPVVTGPPAHLLLLIHTQPTHEKTVRKTQPTHEETVRNIQPTHGETVRNTQLTHEKTVRNTQLTLEKTVRNTQLTLEKTVRNTQLTLKKNGKKYTTNT